MKKYKWVQRAICFIIGHDVEWVIEHRLRNGHISLNRKGGKKRNQSRWGWLEHIKSVHDAERNLVTLKEFGADGTNRKR